MKLDKIERLIKMLENSSLSEIEITDILGRKVRISKSYYESNPVQVTKKAAVAQEQKVIEKKIEEQKTNIVAIKSPIVGTFYRAPAPDAPPYVEVGDIVKPGQVVCIVEAMKLMNEIESDIAGKVVKIVLKNEEPVEYNQELFLVEPM